MIYETKTKKNARHQILSHLLKYGSASKVDLVRDLHLSMPTVLNHMNELMNKGLIRELGEQESTGGRKARNLGLQSDYCYALGMDITAGHVYLVLINLTGEIVKQARYREAFVGDDAWCARMAGLLQAFYRDEVPMEKILGVGVSVPGIVDRKRQMLVRSHALQLEKYSLKTLADALSLPVYFENDANAAMLAENPELLGNAVYLSLKETLGGAICMNGKLLDGRQQKAGEVGHMVLHPGGKRCYCGKNGCADAYCAAGVFREKDSEEMGEYLDDLALLITNIRMFLDTDIILGGDVGALLRPYQEELCDKVRKYNLFDETTEYIRFGSHQKEASAVGVTMVFFERFIERISVLK